MENIPDENSMESIIILISKLSTYPSISKLVLRSFRCATKSLNPLSLQKTWRSCWDNFHCVVWVNTNILGEPPAHMYLNSVIMSHLSMRLKNCMATVRLITNMCS